MEAIWEVRYGEPAPPNAPDVSGFLSHRSVRSFTDQPVSEATIAALVAAAQSASTSSYAQAWSLVSVQEPVRRAAIATLCGSQKQIHSANWFFAFCADLHRGESAAAKAGIEPDALDTVEAFLVATIDAALAAERFVCAAESLGLGVCYIGALRNHPKEVSELLNLPERVFGLFGLCLGYPEPDDARSIAKPRLDQDLVWFKEAYPSEISVDAYDQRMSRFFPKIGVDSKDTWTERQARRFSTGYLSGREKLQDFLDQIGLNKR